MALQIVSKAASAIITNQHKEVLLLLHDDLPLWTDIGGIVEEGESFIEGLHREVFEETQLKIQIHQFVGNFYSILGNNSCRQVQVFVWAAIDEENLHLGKEGIDLAWFPIHKLLFNIAPRYRIRIEEALNNNRAKPIERNIFGPDSLEFLKSVKSFHYFYKIKEWLVHPIVRKKRQDRLLKFDPLKFFEKENK